jgi:hypothetical protein
VQMPPICRLAGGALAAAVIAGFCSTGAQAAAGTIARPHNAPLAQTRAHSSVAQQALLQHGRAVALPLRSAASLQDHRGSWMLAEAKSQKSLLYVADEATNDVDVYSYPKGKPVGQLTGFDTPTGICSAKNGDVYILNGNGTTAVVYAHGGTTPLRTLDLGGYPELNCSVDQKTGNFAVGVIPSDCPSCSGALIAIFAGGQGTPTTFDPAGQFGLPGCAYDASGNLFCDGIPNGSGSFVLYEVPKGGSSVTTMTVDGTVSIGSMMWDGKYLALASGVSGNIAQMQIGGSTATVVNTTVLAGSGTIWQFWIPGVPKPKKQAQASSIIAPTDTSSGGFVGFWEYPAGGNPTKTITGFDQPDGVAVSTLKM